MIGIAEDRSDADLPTAMITEIAGALFYCWGTMALLTTRMILSCAWPGLPDDTYYWQHCGWVDRDDFSSDGSMGAAVLNDAKLLYTSQVRIWSTRFIVPSSGGIHFEQIYGFPQFGSQAAQVNHNLLIAARWQMRGSDDSYTYHLHRQPVGEAYLENGEWSATGLSQQQTRMNTYIAQGIYRTQTGSLIASGHVVARPVMWQLRHGTKRRSSRFWLP